MPRLSLHLLGSPEVALSAHQITDFHSSKVQALLFYLAMEAGRAQRRDSLATLLWPDWPQRDARRNLRNALSNLRKVINDHHTSPSHLLVSRETIQFNGESDAWLDVAEFNVLAATATSDQPVIEELEQAMALYRGHFLEGFSLRDSAEFADWSLLVRERLQRQMLSVLHHLAHHYEARGEYRRACEHARRQVDLLPWVEEAHRQLMRLLALDGRRSAALAQYESCRQLLERELGVEPAEETVALYQQIRDGRLRPPLPVGRPSFPDQPAPYKGLHHFEEEDADIFFGRELLTARLTASLDPGRGRRFLAVVGASGSGKSSIVRAGLLPALRGTVPLVDGSLPPEGSHQWPVHIITPGIHPLEALAVELTRGSKSVASATALMEDLVRNPLSLHLHVRRIIPRRSNHLLLVIDQFEELFTLCRDQAERAAFVGNLSTAASIDGPTIVVIVLRADFYAHCGQFEALRAALENQQVYLGPMSREELRRAVTEPARRHGLIFEPGLVNFLLQEVGDEPGALPLLSHALVETWRRRRGSMLTFGGYTECGGLRGAIAQTAERVLQTLQPQEQIIARDIFLRLTDLGETTQGTRRRAQPAELVSGCDDKGAIQAVLQTLVSARLITATAEGVEIAHEALIREWPTLRGWLEEDREGLRIHLHLAEAAREWELLNRDRGELYRGARLAAASEWATQHPGALNPLESEFLQASQELARRQEAEREVQRQRELEAARQVAEAEARRAEQQAQATTRFRRLAGILAVVFLLAVTAAALALVARSTARLERDRARREAAVNRSLVLAGQAQQAHDRGQVDLALALALESIGIDEPPAEARSVLSAIGLGVGTRALLSNSGDLFRAVTFGPAEPGGSTSGLRSLSGGCGQLSEEGTCQRGELVLWDLDRQVELRRLTGHDGWVSSVAFGPQGDVVISGSEDGTLMLWDASTGEAVRSFVGHTATVNAVAFAPNGHTALSGSDDTTLILWSVPSGEVIHRFAGHTGGVKCLAFSPGGETAISGSADATLRQWDMGSGEPLRQYVSHEAEVWGVALSPDGSKILSAGADHALRFWDLESGEEIAHHLFPAPPKHPSIGPDGRTALFSVDFELRVWDLERWQEQQRLLGHAGEISSLALSADGRLALSSGDDGTLRLWNVSGQDELRRFDTDGTPLIALAVSPDGSQLLTGDMADVATLWSTESGEIIHRLQGDSGAVSPGAVDFSPDGTYTLVGSGDVLGGSGATSLVLWDTLSGKEVRRLPIGPFLGRSVDFAPDGRTALGGSQSMETPEGHLMLFDLESGEVIRRFPTTEDVTDIAFSADGARALTGSAYYEHATLWDVSTGQEIRRFEDDVGLVMAVAFTPDEAGVVTASEEGSLILWDSRSGEPIRRYRGHDRGVWGMDISLDGRYIVSSSEDGTVILWNLHTGEELRRFRGHSAWVPDVAFSRDGQAAYSVSMDGTLIEWRVADPPLQELVGWISANRYVRGLTCDEREQYRVEPLCSVEAQSLQ